MGQLVRLPGRRLPQEFDPDLEREAQLQALARAAADMAETAALIPEVRPALDLPPAEWQAFASLADQLRAQARALAQDAPRLSLQAGKDRLAAIDATCNACHERFREGPVVSAP